MNNFGMETKRPLRALLVVQCSSRLEFYVQWSLSFTYILVAWTGYFLEWNVMSLLMTVMYLRWVSSLRT